MDSSSAAPNPTAFGGIPPYGEAFDAWREAFARKVLKLDADTPHPGEFHANVRAWLLPRVFVTGYDTGPLSLLRTGDLVRDGSDGCTLTICAKGQLELRFGDRELTLGPGEAALVPHHRAGSITTRDHAKSYALRFDREDAHTFVPSIDDLVLRRAANEPAVALARLYCGQVLSGDTLHSVPLASTMASHLRELAAHAINPRSDLARGASGVRAARLEAVQRLIAANLREPWLSAETVGRQIGVSARYVQHLMDGAGLSFSRHVRDLRLEEARRVLQSERGRALRITDIAYGCGFADLSYFNREFRRRFGETPTGWRRRA